MNDRRFGNNPKYRIRLTDLFICMASTGGDKPVRSEETAPQQLATLYA